MASISKHLTTTGEIRWRARVRLREQDISKTFNRKTVALLWARIVEDKVLRMHNFDLRDQYKLIRMAE